MSSTQHDSRSLLKWHYTELDDRDLEIRGRTLFFVIVLFSIILFITVLFLYTRWVCRFSRHAAAAAASYAAPAPPSIPPQGLDAASIKRLPIILHQADHEGGSAWEDTECCICLGEFVDGEKLKVLPGCEHCFHCDCVDTWLTHHSSCPLCRGSLKVENSFPKILIGEPPIRIDIQF